MLGGRCFKVKSVQTYRLYGKGPVWAGAGNASGHPSEVAKYLRRRRRRVGTLPPCTHAMYYHVARGLCPGHEYMRPRTATASLLGAETLDKSAQVVLAGGKTPPGEHHHTSDVGVHGGQARPCRACWVPTRTRSEELSARKISCRRRNMVKVYRQGSWIYTSAHKTGSRHTSRDYPSEPVS